MTDSTLLAAALDWLPHTGCSKAAVKQISDDSADAVLKPVFASWMHGQPVSGKSVNELQAASDTDQACDGFLADHDGDAIVACAAAQIAGRMDVAARLNPKMAG